MKNRVKCSQQMLTPRAPQSVSSLAPQPHPPRVKQGKNLPPWGRKANSSMPLGAAELAPDW